jgi:glycosyltransferase involved in cell wall biosynthesis
MLAGCHVITTKQVAAGEHLLKAGAGTVLDAADPDTLRHAIEVALSDPDLVAESGRRANAYATANLLWNSTAEAIARRVAALRGT